MWSGTHKSLLFFIVFFITIMPFAIGQNKTLDRAKDLFKAKRYKEASVVIDSAMADPSTAKQADAWTLRGYIHYYLYSPFKLKKYNANRDSSVASIERSMELATDSSTKENNKKILKNVAAHYFNQARSYLQDSLNLKNSVFAFNNYKALTKKANPNVDLSDKDKEFYTAIGSVLASNVSEKYTLNGKIDEKAYSDAIRAFDMVDSIKRYSKDSNDISISPTKVNRLLLEMVVLQAKSKQLEKEKIEKEKLLATTEERNKRMQSEKEKQEAMLVIASTRKRLDDLQIEKQKNDLSLLEKNQRLNQIMLDQEKQTVAQQVGEINAQKRTRNVILLVLITSVVFGAYVLFSLLRGRKQKKVILHQKKQIEEKQRELLDSINYAQRIQRSMLASDTLLKEFLNDYFVFFQPKDIVSGDFYWASVLENGHFALVTADSTGHGVPGAIMSMLNIACLNEAVEGKKLTAANEILNDARAGVIKHLSNDGSSEGGKDGMDCSLLVFENKVIRYAGANNPVWIVRNGELIELSPDRMPVGKHARDQNSFHEQVVELKKEDMIYTFTDGYADQFGGPKGKKFMYKKLKEFLIANASKQLDQQKVLLGKMLNEWRGAAEQVDDVTVIGIRVA